MISFLKNTKDIEKSCNNMIKTMKDKMFRMRCYGKNMSYFITSYTKSSPPLFFTTRHNTCFEKLVKSDGAMYRTVDVNMGIPTTPKKVNGLC